MNNTIEQILELPGLNIAINKIENYTGLSLVVDNSRSSITESYKSIAFNLKTSTGFPMGNIHLSYINEKNIWVIGGISSPEFSAFRKILA